MLVDNADALMVWLSSVLEPLCDADPSALSKYVLALIKRDKAESELRDSMTNQMEVFLQENTTSFIDSLFTTLQSGDYVEGPPKVVARKAEADDESGKHDEQEGKPDSTTSTPANVSELASDLKEAEHKQQSPDDDRSRRRSPGTGRRTSSPRRRRSPGHRGRHRSRSRSPFRLDTMELFRRLGRRISPAFGRRSRSRSYSPRPRSPPRRFASRGSTPTKDEETPGYTPSAVSISGGKRPRCRDYDEKGFCLQGDQCKFDHGNDAVVLEDTANPAPPPYMPGGYAEPYVPASTAPALPPLHLPPPGYPPATSALGSTRKRSYEESSALGGAGNYPPAKRFGCNRLGGGRGRGRGGAHGGRQGGASKVLVKNIPAGLNTIAHINNHFTRFGTLVNVQIHFENDPGAALVSFAHPNEATAAMNCPDAVFGNRFIKMFYNYQGSSPQAPVRQRLGTVTTSVNLVNKDSQESVKERISAEGSTITKTIVNTEASAAAKETIENVESNIILDRQISEDFVAAKESKKAATIAAIKRNQEVLELKAKMKKEADVKKTEAIKMTDELRNSKLELLEKLIEEQKKIILKMEEKKGTMNNEEKTSMMALLKSLSTSIEKTKEDIKILLSQQSNQNTRKTFVDVQKELLDAELELFNAQQDGSDHVEEIQKRVNKLRVEAAQKGYLPTSRPARGARGGSPGSPGAIRGGGYIRGAGMYPRGRILRGGFRGRRGGAYGGQPGTTSLDRRPTTILISEVDIDIKDAVLAHMSKFGEVVDTTEDVEESKTIMIQYKTRREAEAAMLKSNQFTERTLRLTWHTSSLGDSAELDLDESDENARLEEQANLLDDYTPLDPAYLPAGLGEDDNKVDTSEEAVEEEQPASEDEVDEEDTDAERSWKR